MSGATYQPFVTLGYKLAADVLGTPHAHHRPIGPAAPLAPATLLGTLPAFFATEPDLKLRKPGTYKDPIRYGAFDYAQTQPGDYLVGPELTLFVASLDPLLPALCIECNRVLTISRQSTDPQAGTPAGGGPRAYGGRAAATVPPTPQAAYPVLLSGWPASVLLGTKGESAPASGRLPDDTRAPWWAIKLPALPVALGGPVLGVTDRIVDDLGRIYVISGAELSERGWNLTAQQAVV